MPSPAVFLNLLNESERNTYTRAAVVASMTTVVATALPSLRKGRTCFSSDVRHVSYLQHCAE